MKPKNTFYITTPIYYTNAAPHIGSAYTTIAADVLARWNRLKGKEVFFLTGTDEHGKKIQETAEKSGKSPKEFVDSIVSEFKEAWKILNISNDNFIRTTDKYHEKEVQKILQELYEKNLIYKGIYESYYCTACEQYLTKNELVDGCCPIHKTKVELKKEEAYLFRLSKFQDKILKAIKSEKFLILPVKRKNEMISFIESGLQDISISRKKSEVFWGIELPFDKNHTCYVWIDAFWNYISGLKTNENKKKFWPADIQLMANDILRVHATIWPALLLALDYELPKKMFIHGFFTINGQKMSKSLGNVIDPVYLSNRYGTDSLRYYMLRAIPFGEDGDVSEKALASRHNNELADKLGNLVSRVSGLIEKNGTKKTPNKLIKNLREKEIEKLMEACQLDKALNEIFAFIDVCNEYVQSKKPWETKDKKVLYELKESILKIAELLNPFVPETSEKITKCFTSKSIKKSDILFKKIQ
ncbi:MAG: methionine--tRNA ligase [Candidatus Pacearchaeota archaeon]